MKEISKGLVASRKSSEVRRGDKAINGRIEEAVSELRQDFATREWVVIATERAKRPHLFTSARGEGEVSAWDENCPFCPGNELRTAPEVFKIEGTQSSWRVRVVPNKYPALTPEGSTTRKVEEEFFRRIEGVGVHEVIIESPLHNGLLALLDEAQIEQVLFTYRARYNALKPLPFIRFVSIFRNQGERAGTSLRHPHSQLVGTPVAPPYIRRKLETALQYYDDMGTCLYCDLFHHELEVGKRIVVETESFMVFHPYASRSPFETWIAPKKHQTSFGLISDEELPELAGVLKDILRRLYKSLNNPDFNYVICSSPTEDEYNQYYDWHIVIIPRLTTPAGFEMGSGIYINTALPEETAEFMRGVCL